MLLIAYVGGYSSRRPTKFHIKGAIVSDKNRYDSLDR